MFENSLVIDPPGLGFNFEISFIAAFNSLSDRFNFSESFANFFLENNSNSDSIILIELKIDSLELVFLFNWIKRHSWSDLAPTPGGSRSWIFF